MPRVHQLEAVAKVLDCTDVLAIIPTGADKITISAVFMLVLTHMKATPDGYVWNSAQFPDDPIVFVVYPTNWNKYARILSKAGEERDMTHHLDS